MVFKGILLFAVAFLSSCAGNDVLESSLPKRFQCMSVPSGLYTPGTVLRTIPKESDKDDVDDLTLAFKTDDTASLSGSYGDVSSSNSRKISGEAFVNYFKDLGYTGEISAGTSYIVSASIRGNSHLVFDDTQLKSAIEKLESNDAIKESTRYFLVKEAVASNEVIYNASNNVGADISVDLKALDSKFATELTFVDGETEIEGKKLIACVYLEEANLTTVRNFAGPDEIKVEGFSPVLKNDYERLDKAMRDSSLH